MRCKSVVIEQRPSQHIDEGIDEKDWFIVCYTCWQQYGSPKIVSDKVLEAVAAIEEVYNYSLVGGGMHIAVDDWNLEDSHLDACEKWIADPEHCLVPDVDGKQTEVERKCLSLLRALTVDERASALAIYEGFVES